MKPELKVHIIKWAITYFAVIATVGLIYVAIKYLPWGMHNGSVVLVGVFAIYAGFYIWDMVTKW